MSSALDALPVREALASKYAAFEAAIWQQTVVPHRVLHLCRARIAQIHCVSLDLPEVSQACARALERQEYDQFAATERAALEVAEQIPFNHHGVSDAMVESLKDHFQAAGTVTLLTALGLFDVTCRVAIAFNLPADE